MEKLAVIIPAAGSGTRRGSFKPKPFIILGDKPIIWHTINAFLKLDSLIQIIIPTSKEWLNEVEIICESLPKNKVQFDVIVGGSERQFSINNGLKFLHDDVDLVAVHDAVRPFIDWHLIKKVCKRALTYGGAIVGVPAKDTIKKVGENQTIIDTPNRTLLWQAQTPQIFRRELLTKAYNSAIEKDFFGTDDASLVERIGGDIKIVEGDRKNLKITYPIDLKIAEMILKENEEI